MIMSKQVLVDQEEKCEGLACSGQGKVSWVLNNQEFDEEEEDLIEIKYFVCSACNNKHKRKIDTRTIASCILYLVKTRTVSKEIISWMSNKLITLLDILPTVEGEIRKLLLDTTSNQIMLWNLAGEKVLAHLERFSQPKK